MIETTIQSDIRVQEEWDALLFGVRRSIRYYLHRCKFFETLKVTADFLVIVSGGTVVSLASTGEKRTIGVIIAGALTAVIGSLDLVIGFSSKARDYRDLVKDFSQLERDMTASEIKRENLIKFTNRRLELEQSEPQHLRVLNMYCHNELVIALDYPKDNLAKLSFFQSLFRQFIDIFPDRIRTEKQRKDELEAKNGRQASPTPPKPA